MPFWASLSAQAGCIFCIRSIVFALRTGRGGWCKRCVRRVIARIGRCRVRRLARRNRFVCLLPRLPTFLCGRAQMAVTSACVRMVTPFRAQAASRALRTSRASIERGKILPSSRSMRETPSSSMKRQARGCCADTGGCGFCFRSCRSITKLLNGAAVGQIALPAAAQEAWFPFVWFFLDQNVPTGRRGGSEEEPCRAATDDDGFVSMFNFIPYTIPQIRKISKCVLVGFWEYRSQSCSDCPQADLSRLCGLLPVASGCPSCRGFD